MNIVCTGKPGDGLLRYSYEHCCYLNSIGIKCQVVIIPNPKHTKEDYIKAENREVKYIGRKPAASPASGYLKKHLAQQKEIIEKVLS